MAKEIRQGELYWLDFGLSSGSASAERHPCVVVQSDVFNRTRIATSVVNVSQVVTVDRRNWKNESGEFRARHSLLS